MEMHTLREFLSDVQWGALDILLLDLPPGADRVSTIRDLLPDLHGTVVVTIPSAVSHLVVLKSITLARDLLHTPVLGLVENMTSYVCPTCEQVHPLFGPTSSEEMPWACRCWGVSPLIRAWPRPVIVVPRISWSMVPPLRDRRCSRWESAYARV